MIFCRTGEFRERAKHEREPLKHTAYKKHFFFFFRFLLLGSVLFSNKQKRGRRRRWRRRRWSRSWKIRTNTRILHGHTHSHTQKWVPSACEKCERKKERKIRMKRWYWIISLFRFGKVLTFKNVCAVRTVPCANVRMYRFASDYEWYKCSHTQNLYTMNQPFAFWWFIDIINIWIAFTVTANGKLTFFSISKPLRSPHAQEWIAFALILIQISSISCFRMHCNERN